MLVIETLGYIELHFNYSESIIFCLPVILVVDRLIMSRGS